jgi:Ca2+/Na+ antiporter
LLDFSDYKSGKKQRNYYLMLPSKETVAAVIDKMEKVVESNERIANMPGLEVVDATSDKFGGDSDEHVSFVAFPEYGSALIFLFIVLVYPCRVLIHWTIPDGRCLDDHGKHVGTLSKAFFTIGVCFLWFIGGSYAVVSLLEHKADLLRIPTALIGVTVCAAGTSLPNYVAPRVATEKGFGVSTT